MSDFVSGVCDLCSTLTAVQRVREPVGDDLDYDDHLLCWGCYPYGEQAA